MKEIWSRNWKKVLIWLCGYVHLIAFVIAGGYAIVKSNDKELQKTAKTVLVITLIFTAIEALISILNRISLLGANMGTALNWISFFVILAKIGVFAAGIIMSLFDVSVTSSKTEKRAEPLKSEKTSVGQDAASEQSSEQSADTADTDAKAE